MPQGKRLTRRSLFSSKLLGVSGGAVAPGGRQPDATPRLTLRPESGPAGDVLVCLFMRGGMDGLHVVAPHGDPLLYRMRPALAVPRPDDNRAAVTARAVDLDGFFGLNPLLTPLKEAYDRKRLAIIHAIGTPDQTRSHFEAMETMERGVSDGAAATTGWLARHLSTVGTASHSPMRALALGDQVPQSLHGAMGATAVPSLDVFELRAPDAWGPGYRQALEQLYAADANDTGRSAGETFALLDTLARLRAEKYQPEHGASYPTTHFGNGLQQIARLIKAEVGLEVACLDLGGWDSHVGQGPWLVNLLEDLGKGLAAFHADMESQWNRVTVVVMSEFGRRIEENTGIGTDHGRGTCMFVLGGAVAGGQVYRKWPRLDEPEREGDPLDLQVTTDYRDVLGQIVRHRLRNPHLDQVFPKHTFNPAFSLVAPRA